MKTKTSIITLAFFCLTASFSFAQSGQFASGYYVDLSGDTIQGYIQKIQKQKLNTNFHYKSKVGSTNDLTIYASQCQSFTVLPYDRYISIKDSTTKSAIFAKILATGPLTLYVNYTESPYVYYITDTRSKQQYTLTKEDKSIDKGEETYAHSDTRYIGALRFLMQDCDKVNRNIENITYNDKALIKLIDRYNNCVDTATAYQSNLNKIKIRWGAQAGTFFQQQRTHYLYNNTEIETKAGWMVGPAAVIELTNRLDLNLGIIYTQFQSTIDNFQYISNPHWIEHVDFQFKYIDFPVNLTYRITSGKWQPLLYGGFVYGIIIQHEYTTDVSYDHLDGTFEVNMGISKWGLVLGAGLSYNKTLTLKAGYSINSFLKGVNSMMSTRGFEIKLGYYL